MYLEKIPYKNILLSENPDLVLFSYEEGLDEHIKKYGLLTKEITPNALTGVIGEEDEDFLEIDFQLGKSPYSSFMEILLGIETERSIEEILIKVKSVRNKERTEEINLSQFKMEDRYVKMYNCLQYEGIRDVFSIKRFSHDDNLHREMDHGELREIKDIIDDIEERSMGVYLKDGDLFLDGNRLKSLIEALEERDLKGVYIARGDIYTIIVQSSLMERFSKLGLKTVVLDLEFPQDEEGWIKIKEAIMVLRSINVEPLFVLREELSKEDEEALVFFLKENKEGLILLKEGAYGNNRSIYKDLSLSFGINLRWTKDFGVLEALRRSKKYKEALN